jgi:hypothetical protein
MSQLVKRNTEEDKTVHWKIIALWGGKRRQLHLVMFNSGDIADFCLALLVVLLQTGSQAFPGTDRAVSPASR